MKSIKYLFITMLALSGFFVSAQSVDEVISKNIEAMGGKDKIGALKSIKMTGSMNVQGTDISLTLVKLHMIGMRMDIEAMGTSNYRIANNTKGWIFMPVMGMAAPKEMDTDEFNTSINQMDIQGNLFNYKEKGTVVELSGKEMVEGSEAYKIKATFKNGQSTNYFIDTKTNRIVKTTAKRMVNGKEMDIETTFSNYKQNADGYWFSYSSTNSQGTIVMDKIETNIPVDENIFKN